MSELFEPYFFNDGDPMAKTKLDDLCDYLLGMKEVLLGRLEEPNDKEAVVSQDAEKLQKAVDTLREMEAWKVKAWFTINRLEGALRDLDCGNCAHLLRGRWIENTVWIGAFGQIQTKCSVCGTTYPGRMGSRGDGKGGKYCEECGAKMEAYDGA